MIYANYFLVPLNQRVLRLSRKGAHTEYNWTDKVCVKKVLGICIRHDYPIRTEIDFDFTKQVDRDRFNEMGFKCSIEKRL
jgi:hypothetical protein